MDSLVNHYATINDFDPRTNTWKNGTEVIPDSASSLWQQIELFIIENFPVICVIVFVVFLCILFGWYR